MDSLFILFSGARTSRSTIARWLRLAIGQAYTLKGKEVRYQGTFHKSYDGFVGGESWIYARANL